MNAGGKSCGFCCSEGNIQGGYHQALQKTCYHYAWVVGIYGGAECYALISQNITSENHEDFGIDELFPIKSIEYSDRYKVGAYGDIILTMRNGSVKKINFDSCEGKLML